MLESDTLSKTFTPNPRYDEEERDTFYQQLADVGALLTAQAYPLFSTPPRIGEPIAMARDTRSRISWRSMWTVRWRRAWQRDPKGIYQQAQESPTAKVPGLQTAYEPPEAPDLVVKCEGESPEAAAGRVVALLVEKGYIR